MAIDLKYRFASAILKVISSTWRYHINGDIVKSPAVIAFWHGSMLPVWKYFAKYRPYAVVSRSKDGAILTDMLESWGYNVLRGSSSKGGKEVLNDMQYAAGKGYLLITPDGPRGPIYEFKAGAVIAANRAGVALQLCGVKINRKICLTKSWDRFRLPLPFTKIELKFSGPILIQNVPSREVISEIIEKCQNDLNRLNGDDLC